ncbi:MULTISPECIES: response regulator transcription factor [Clostridium]|uniref:Stage 0 sporulation protein A homolog n=2 Tax=Clostridium TaxID=1485 RepID=A0A151AKY3_9CLOT|nr:MULTISPECIES: response regulator transcription factor [Clostridium]KYH28255.1 transcriptional regulatory protein SrrA [Clostridium colicanis DSM 13634]PRR76536.1 Transcriptional regulatory protein SrrA [Clostridium thermopalmarium DSM 5974]PVZ28351.1 DNA-binding response OmpR family regulator [Clostridium thermopalmarium DSM 5974]
MNETILIIEDEERMRKLLRDYFKDSGFNILECDNGIKALDLFKNNRVDLVILDIMIPYMDGWTVCNKIREVSDIPIIMLTAKSEEEDKLLGYELGADDYVTKPFSPKVLVAKAKALLKRSNGKNKLENETKKFNGLEINPLSHEVKIDGEEIQLSPKEYDLLLFFAKNEGISLSRDVILDKVWGFDYYGGLRTVDTHVKRLREKLKHKADYIVTVRGSGYKFEVKE